MVEPFSVLVSRHVRRCMVTITGELDIATAPVVDDVLERAMSESFRVLALDLTGVSFIDSSGLHLLLRYAQLSRLDGDGLRIACSRPVERAIALSGIQDLLPIGDR